MNISVVDKSPSQKQIELTISVEEMQPYVARATKDLGARVQMPGFRAGKVPADLVRSTLGDGKIWEEAAQRALEETLGNACKDHALDLLSLPAIEVLQLAPGNDFRYRATVEVVPPIVLCDIRAVAREIYKKEHGESNIQVQEQEVKDALDWLTKSRATYRDVARSAQKGDVVDVGYEGKIGGIVQQGFEQTTQAFMAGTEAGIESQASIESAILGMQKGEEKDIVLLLPESYPDPGLRGRSLNIHLLVKNVSERIVPTLNDEFARSAGNFQALGELEESVRKGIQAEKEKREDERITLLQLEEIARQSHVDAPEILVDQELDRMKDEFSRELSGLGATLSSYLDQIKKTEAGLRNGWKEKAQDRVKAGLVLRAIARQENIAIDEQEADKRASAIVARYASTKEAYEHEGSPESLRARVRGSMRNEKVLELLRKGLMITD